MFTNNLRNILRTSQQDICKHVKRLSTTTTLPASNTNESLRQMSIDAALPAKQKLEPPVENTVI